MDIKKRSLQTLGMIGSYVPRKCGIATFSKDLHDALIAEDKALNTYCIAMDNKPEGYL